MGKATQRVARLHRAYVQQVVEKTGVKPTPLAKAIGIAPSTLTRLLNEPDDSAATLHAGTLAKLEAFSGITPPTDYELSHPVRHGPRDDAEPFVPAEAPPDLAHAVKVLTSGRKSIEAWLIRSRALECAGYVPGDAVIVDLAVQPRAGDPVCAQIHERHSSVTETVMRFYEPPYLMPSTFDETLRRPIVVDKLVQLKGVILPYRLRARPADRED